MKKVIIEGGSRFERWLVNRILFDECKVIGSAIEQSRITAHIKVDERFDELWVELTGMAAAHGSTLKIRSE